MAEKKTSKATASTAKVKKKARKNIANAVAHILATFNNTIVNISDEQGNTIAWASSGTAGFKGSRKSTPFAAQLAAEQCARKAMEHGVRSVEDLRERARKWPRSCDSQPPSGGT